MVRGRGDAEEEQSGFLGMEENVSETGSEQEWKKKNSSELDWWHVKLELAVIHPYDIW